MYICRLSNLEQKKISWKTKQDKTDDSSVGIPSLPRNRKLAEFLQSHSTEQKRSGILKLVIPRLNFFCRNLSFANKIGVVSCGSSCFSGPVMGKTRRLRR